MLRGAVAQRGQIGDQSDVPEEQRDRRVGRDREDVPHQRAAELRPQPHRVRVREEPEVVPGTAGVQRRIQPRRRDGEQRHRLGESVDRRAPLLPQQQQNRGDQRAGVADADPPDEVEDVHAPSDRMVDAPDADALADQHRRSSTPRACRRTPRATRKPMIQPSGVLLRRTIVRDVIRDRGERVSRLDRRRRDEALRDAHLLRGRTELVDGCWSFVGHGYHECECRA